MTDSTQTAVYYYANKELIAKKNTDGSKVYYHNDHLGSNALTTNQWGSLVETTTYNPQFSKRDCYAEKDIAIS